ncbi:hypothetical protein, partial [Neisseria gonorrhoeae]|uniref:hypothetical protein n=1 Tax=Neisseria gonorrhoeae TaxID=485 RepID=UPI001C55C7A4
MFNPLYQNSNQAVRRRLKKNGTSQQKYRLSGFQVLFFGSFAVGFVLRPFGDVHFYAVEGAD